MPTANRQKLQIAWNREGVIFLLLALGLAFASVYTGQNAIVLLFCVFAAVLSLSAWFGGQNVGGLIVERRFIEEIYAQKEAQIELIVYNPSSRTRHGLHLYEDFGGVSEIGPMYIDKLGPRQTAVLRYSCIFPTRGVSRFQQIQLRSRYPLPFFEFRSRMPKPDTALVYPSLDPETTVLTFHPLEASLNLRRSMHDWSIQPVIAGRITGRILWKLSARQGQLVQRHARFRSHAQSEVISLKSRQELGRAAFERQASQAAHYCIDSLEHGRSIALYASDGSCLLEAGSGSVQRLAVLEILAQI